MKLGNSTADVSVDANYQNGCVIDSPGIRELGIWHLTSESVLDGFDEIKHYSKSCKFRNCKHSEKEDKFCAVRKAVADGLIMESRYRSFIYFMSAE